MLLGILVKPLDSPSTKYITVPIMMTNVNTKNTKTLIFSRLAHIARRKVCPALVYLVSFRIRNTRNKRNTRITTKLWEPMISKLK